MIQLETDTDKSLVQKIVDYMKRFRKEKALSLNFLDKGAMMRTDKSKYYLKFDSMYWILAGHETGKFKGAGFSLNNKFYNIIKEFKLDVLYCNKPNFVYLYHHDNYENNSFYHKQSYNDERVRVISIAIADDVWKV